ncbi:MAG: hypothetical protein LIO53_06925 [Oscillospiraceae bacterium]|nr:hypothetical protein [Oscillospiraceae bacterium]
MKKATKKSTKKDSYSLFENINTDIITLCFCVTAVLFILWTFTGQWPWSGHYYNSYILQAQSWLEGRLDLGQNYSWLELAIFNNKYYVSFPPFPSYVMLPFVALGWDTCDGMIAFAASLLGAVYAFKIAEHFGVKGKSAVFFALFLTVGSNWLMTAQNAWVWFIAQNMSFTLCLMAIYYALKNKAGLSLAFWACAVGCRPLTVIFIPVLLYLIYKAHMTEYPDDKITDIIKKRFTAVIPMVIIALSYMILNYARFGSIVEFGHNYLPEFTESEYGQFSLTYIKENMPAIFRLPEVEDGVWQYPAFNGMCIFLVSPIFISYIVYTVRSFLKKTNNDIPLTIMIVLVSILYIIALTAHKTMGGSHFGNRYTNDILPIVFLGLMLTFSKDGKWKNINYPLMFIGFALNLIGTVNYFIGYL